LRLSNLSGGRGVRLPILDARVDQWAADPDDEKPGWIKNLLPAIQIGHQPLYRFAHEEVVDPSDAGAVSNRRLDARRSCRQFRLQCQEEILLNPSMVFVKSIRDAPDELKLDPKSIPVVFEQQDIVPDFILGTAKGTAHLDDLITTSKITTLSAFSRHRLINGNKNGAKGSLEA